MKKKFNGSWRKLESLQVGEGVNVSLIIGQAYSFLRLTLVASIITKKQHIFNTTFCLSRSLSTIYYGSVIDWPNRINHFLQDVSFRG